jgi:protein phosphatase
VVSSDECRALISDNPANQAVSRHAFELMHFIIEKRLLLRRFTVADATNLTREARSPLVKLSRRFHFNIAAIIFDIPIGICLARNARRSRVVPEEALMRQQAMLENTLQAIFEEDFDYIFVLNESNQSRIIVEIGPAVCNT